MARRDAEALQRALAHLQAFETRSARLLGGWLPGIERWEVKHQVGMHLFEDAQRAHGLRTRLWELRVVDPDRGVGEGPAAVAQALASAPSDVAFLAGAYLAVKQALLQAYDAYLADTYSVYDAPTVAALGAMLPTLRAQLVWAEGTLRDLIDSGEKRREADRFMGYVRDVIAAHGGVDGGRSPLPPVAPPPGLAPMLPFDDARRDARFDLSAAPLPLPSEENPLAYTLFQFANYGAEMQAAETLGSILYETDGMPWEFYYDVARHCTDEVRHSKLGEERLAQLGRHVTDFPHTTGNYAYRQQLDPLRRYCALTYVIEADSFAYKHRSHAYYLAQGDRESAEAVLYDILDETLHVRWGKKWVPELMKHAGYPGDVEALVTECRALVAQRSFSAMQRSAATRRGA
jgi:hypothetical protein